MQLLDLTLPTPQENVALDDALLREAEHVGRPLETLRVWQPAAPLVVVGRSSQLADEVDVEACRADRVPVLRRTSGGAAVVTGPGCLMYAVVLSYRQRPHLRAIDQAHCFVLQRVAVGLRSIGIDARPAGTSDLAVAGRKVSGNSMRCAREHLLYHGTLLCDLDLALLSRYLRMPPRQPEYRAGRGHEAFVANLPATLAAVRDALVGAWYPEGSRGNWPEAEVQRLVAEKYGLAAWNEQVRR